MISIDVLRAMYAAGAPVEAIFAAIEADQKKEADFQATEIARRRALDAARQQKVRDNKRHESSRDVTLRHAIPCDERDVTIPENTVENQQLNGSTNLYIDSSLTSSSDSKEERKKEDSSVVARATPKANAEKWTPKFAELWAAYPRRQGNNPKHPALLKFIKLAQSGVDLDSVIAGARAYAADAATQVGTPYVKTTVVWLNQRCWEDYAQVPKPNDVPAYMKPPPGCQTYEDFRRQYDAAKNENPIREDTGMGEDGADFPEELRLSS